MKDKFGRYAYPTHKENLTNEEKADLIRIIQQGKKDGTTESEEWREAFIKLIEHSYPLAIKYASRYRYKFIGRVLQLEDFYQRAMEAVCNCAYQYDGDHFGIYLKRSIQNGLLEERAAFLHPLKLHPQYFLELGKLINEKNPEKRLLKEASEKKLLEVTSKPLLLDDPCGAKEDNTIGDLIPDPSSLDLILDDGENWEKEVQLRFIRAGIDQLPERRKKVLFYRYGFDGEEKTTREIASILKIGIGTESRDAKLATEFLQKFCHVIPGRVMKDISDYRNDAKIFLGDAGGRRYADNLLDMGFREALERFRQSCPHKENIKVTVSAIDGGTAIINFMADPDAEILSVRDQNNHFLDCGDYTAGGKLYLTFNGEDQVKAGDSLMLEIALPHLIKGLDDASQTNFPDKYAMILIKGASAASMRIRARSITEVFGKRPEDGENLISQSQEMWESFLRDLHRLEKTYDPLPRGGFPI